MTAGASAPILAWRDEALDGVDGSPIGRLRSALAASRNGDADAIAMMQELAARHPAWDEPELRAAEHLRGIGDMRAAEQAYRRALLRNPHRSEALIGLGALLMARTGTPDSRAEDAREAQGLLQYSCALAPEHAEAWDAFGLALLLAGDAAAAQEALAEAQRLDPKNTSYALHGVTAALAADAGEAALAALEAASEADPLNAALLIARGELLGALGRRDDAIDALQAAVALAPDDAVAHARLGEFLARSLRQGEAEAALRLACTLDPENAENGLALSVVLMRLHRFTESAAILRGLIERHGDDAAFYCNLATTSTALGLQEEAEVQARRGIALLPDHPETWRVLCNALPYRSGIAGAELLEAATECARRLPRGEPHAFAVNRDPERRLRLGLMSGTLKVHPVGWLTIAGFEALDREEFEIVCLTPNRPVDAIGERFCSIAAEWVDSFALDDAALADRIRALGIDVLIDLGGYGDFGRMPVCARRAAPVQMKWVGMQNHSTGLPEMDWFVTDRWGTPRELERFYRERPLRLPDGYVCYNPPGDAPEVAPLPALQRGHPSFGCYNNLAKITPEVIAVWSTILKRVETARLVLKAHQYNEAPVRKRLLAAFAAQGIAAERLVLRGSSPHRALLAEYAEIDIVLDPFPYSGGLTTCEALWMGVPTVTLPGEIFASRHSLSHMSNVGLADWVAADLEDYVALAVRKAGDLPALASLRAGMRARVKASPLCDAARFGRNLGAALRGAWREWCAGPPAGQGR